MADRGRRPLEIFTAKDEDWPTWGVDFEGAMVYPERFQALLAEEGSSTSPLELNKATGFQGWTILKEALASGSPTTAKHYCSAAVNKIHRRVKTTKEL
jgi:hypothetical protein